MRWREAGGSEAAETGGLLLLPFTPSLCTAASPPTPPLADTHLSPKSTVTAHAYHSWTSAELRSWPLPSCPLPRRGAPGDHVEQESWFQWPLLPVPGPHPLDVLHAPKGPEGPCSICFPTVCLRAPQAHSSSGLFRSAGAQHGALLTGHFLQGPCPAENRPGPQPRVHASNLPRAGG